MVLPGKTADYKQSVISKFPLILKILSDGKVCSISKLEQKTKNSFSSIVEFIQTLDCLFLLGKIELNEEKNGVLICL